MSSRRPLVRINGKTRQMPSGDTLPSDCVSGSSSDVDPELCHVRLSATSSSPLPTDNITAATSVYILPMAGGDGEGVSLYDASAGWYKATVPGGGVSLAVPATANTTYDVYLYNSGSVSSPTLVAEAVAWSGDTPPARGSQNGIATKNGALGRRWIGCFRTTGTSGQTEDSITRRFVWNLCNQVDLEVRTYNTNTAWSYSLSVWREANGGSGQVRGEYILGKTSWGKSRSQVYASGSGYRFLSLDSTGTTNAGIQWNSSSIVQFQESAQWLSPGYHYTTIIEYAHSGGLTCYGNYGYYFSFKG